MKKLILCFLVLASLIACTDNKETIIEENEKKFSHLTLFI